MAGAERISSSCSTRKDVAPPTLLPDACCRSRDLPTKRSRSSTSTFEYKPGVPVLRDVGFVARRGGSGFAPGGRDPAPEKTTVASLLLRLYEPQGGAVRVLGRGRFAGTTRKALRRLFLRSYRRDVFLFSGTILSNIANRRTT